MRESGFNQDMKFKFEFDMFEQESNKSKQQQQNNINTFVKANKSLDQINQQ